VCVIRRLFNSDISDLGAGMHSIECHSSFNIVETRMALNGNISLFYLFIYFIYYAQGSIEQHTTDTVK